MPALAMTDHGNVFGAYDFYRKAQRRRGQADHRHGGLPHPRAPPGSTGPGCAGHDGGDDDVSGGGAYTHMTLLAETTAGMHNLFRLSSRSSLEGFFYKPRADRELLAELRHGPDRAPPAARPARSRPGCGSATTTKARAAAAEFQDIFGTDNFFLELMDHGLDDRDPGPRRPAPAGQGPAACRWSPPTTCTTPTPEDADGPRGAAVRAVRQDDGRPEPVQVRRATTTTSSRRPRCASCGRTYGLREACDNTLLIAERCEVELRRVGQPTCRASRCPTGETEESWFVKEVERGPAPPLPRRHHRPRCRKQAEYEVGVIIQMGFPGYFLVVADFINWAKDNGIRVGPGRGSGAGSMVAYAMRHHRPRPARARADLRAVPQPRARLDARLRHRLRRAPARRGDPLRHREVRRRPGRADRHLRHHQGQAGGQGRRAGARLPVRDGRPDHQGDAAAGDGQGRPARGDLRQPTTSATARAASSARCTRPTPTSSGSSTPPAASRG